MLPIPRCNAGSNRLLRAELIGSNRCAIAGFVATSGTPVTTLCRTLLAAGFDPTTRLDCFRGNTLALRVQSIGEGARLTVKDNRLGRPVFARWQDRDAQGVEDVKGAAPFMAPLLKKPAYRQPIGKAEQRKQATNAFMTWREKHMSEPGEDER